MKKFFSFLALPLCLGLAMLSSKLIKANESLSDLVFANMVTCYSTYQSGGAWNIYDCGDCEQVTDVFAFTDRLQCNTSSGY